MSLRFAAASMSVPDPQRAGEFWAALLGRTATTDERGVLLPADPGQLALRFTADPAPRTDPDLWHLHVNGDEPGAQQRLVERALGLGATHLDVGQRPEEGHVVLADPSSTALCVLEDDSSFVAGCGPLGELACDGTRAVGVFWSRVLDWDLVWDQDEETAIQSPYGGTKVAWGGPPLNPRTVPRRQRFELAVDHAAFEGERDRLLSLGAAPIAAHPGGLFEFADPDGNEFHLVVDPPL